jgi:hypothetical protein
MMRLASEGLTGVGCILKNSGTACTTAGSGSQLGGSHARIDAEGSSTPWMQMVRAGCVKMQPLRPHVSGWTHGVRNQLVG